MKLHRMAALCVLAPLSACATNDQLMFVSQNTLGVKIGVGAETQPLTFSVGYTSYDGAMMPAVMRGPSGEPKLVHGRHHYCGSTSAAEVKECVALQGSANVTGAKGDLPAADAVGTPQNGLVVSEDALSVVSSFGANSQAAQGTNTSVSTKLGKMFATGVSAQRISEGLKAELTYANSAACITAINAGGFDTATKVELIKAKC